MTKFSLKSLLGPLLFFILLASSSCQHGNHASGSASPDSAAATATPSPAAPVKHADATTDTVAPERVITPGTSIGQTFLEESPDTLVAILGKPDYQDAAMGKAWLTWFGKKRDQHNNRTELNVFLTYRDSTMSHKVVRQIRTTSSWFLLEDSLHVYSAFPSIENAFPGVSYVGKYTEDGRVLKIYDDLAQGVAFETVSAGGQIICTAILVHVPGTPLSAVFFPIHGQAARP